MLNITILTIFPEMFPGPFAFSLNQKAINNNLWNLNIINIRDFAEDKYKSVDDKTYGGGYGLVMRPDILEKAIEYAITLQNNNKYKIFYPSPRGAVFNQQIAQNMVNTQDNLIFLCGRFEGIDQRIIEEYNITEISIGDFVLSGGEIAAMTIIDTIIRLIPDVIKRSETIKEESFASNSEYEHLLEYPHYTKPAIWKNRKIPSILLSGNHQEIRKWRLEQAKTLTKTYRPDLWQKYLNNTKSTLIK